jgi:hypothetical protein
MKFKKMFIFMMMAVVFTSCEAGFDDMMSDTNNADAALQSVQISSGHLSPIFSRGKTSYSLNAGENVNTVTVTVVPVNVDSTMNFRTAGGVWQNLINGNEALVTGILGQTIRLDIQVTSFDGKGSVIYSFLTISGISAVVPTLSTTIISSINSTTAISGGAIITDGGSEIIARGVCWSTSALPTIDNSKTIDGSGTGSFSSNISGLLKGGEEYHVRAYATNVAGTGYGDDIILKTCGYTGPGGGLVFYDRGQYTIGDPSGNWRYMEAAPADLPATMRWCNSQMNDGYYPSGTFITSVNVGEGLSNTTKVIARYQSESRTAIAAEACQVYSNNSFSDWFLPSVGEVELMYSNLHQNGVGGFKAGINQYYWTSTEDQTVLYWYQYSEAFRFYGSSWTGNMANNYNYDGTYDIYVRPARRF